LFFAPPGALLVALLVQVIVGFGNGGTLIMPPAMTADTVDCDELQSGERQMGGHMAFLAMVFKGGIMLGAPLAFALMAYSGFEGAWDPVTTSQAAWIRLCGSLIPAILLLVPIALMWNFPLDAARHAIVRAELLTRRTRNAAT
jgi:glycoside/pentoside/hexuronide:cation symporter, GPH family